MPAAIASLTSCMASSRYKIVEVGEREGVAERSQGRTGKEGGDGGGRGGGGRVSRENDQVARTR